MAKLRHEINLITALWDGSSSISEHVLLDTKKYSGVVTYYLEIVSKNTNTSTADVQLERSGTSTIDCTITVPASETAYTLHRQSFTPYYLPTGYHLNCNKGTLVGIKSARIVILQVDAPISSLETQIEIGSAGSTSSTTAVAVSKPKYWKYTSANWDATTTAYFEATFKSGTSKSASTVTLQVSDGTGDGFTGWTAVVSVTTTATTETRVRSSAISLTNGRNYRIAITSPSSKSAMYVYGAKIVILSTAASGSSEDDYPLSELEPAGDANLGTTTFIKHGQSFTGYGSALTSLSLWLAKYGSPTGQITAEIYAHSGTYGTSSVPTGSALATSTNTISEADLPVGENRGQLCTFLFDGSLTLTNGTKYVLVLSTTTSSNTDYPRIGRRVTSAAHSGNQCYYSAGAWNALATTDLIFYVNTVTPVTEFETQYLVAASYLLPGTALQGFLVAWDSSEWSGVTNAYYHVVDAANGSTSDAQLEEADGGGAVTNSAVTDPDNQGFSSAMTMPTTQTLDVKATTNNNDLYSSRIVVLVTLDAVVGLAHLKSRNGVVFANNKSIIGVLNANIKSVDGIT